MRFNSPVGILRLWALVMGMCLPLASLSVAAEPPAHAVEAETPYVRLGDHRLFALSVARGNKAADVRAREATQALAAALETPGPRTTHVEENPEGATLFVGAAPILQVGQEDATAAGDANLKVYSASIQARVDQAVRAEEKRFALQTLVLSISMAVFVGLLFFLAIRKLGDLEGAVERWLEGRPQGSPAVRLGNVELASERAVRGGLHVALRFSKRVLQVLLVYIWFLFVLSRFEVTSGLGDRITRMMLEPVGRVLAHLVGAIPQLLALAVLAVFLFVIIRSVQLFFGSVARGETHLAWVPADLARPTGLLLQGALLVLAVVFAGPVISGGSSSPFQGLAQAMLIGLAVACAPLFAAVVAGLPVVYGRGVRVGEVAEIGGQVGIVKEVDLLSVVLEDAGGRAVRVPHLISLFQPTRVLGPAPLTTVDVTVVGSEDQPRVQALLLEAAGSHASGARVELRALDARGALYRVTSGYQDVGLRAAGALKDGGVELAALGEAGANR